MKKIIEIIPELISFTQSGKMKWEYMEDAPCLTSSYNNNNFILCKTETDSGMQVISLNYINDNGEIIGDFMKWEKGVAGYDYVDNLNTIAQQSQVLTVC